MKRLLIIACVVAASLVASSQQGNTIVIGKMDTLHSLVLNETRRLWVYLPASATNKMFTQQRYPVLYLLDAPSHFHSVTGLVQQLSSVSGNTVVPEMIVIGIQNTDRTRDLTPTRSTSSAFGQTPEMLKTSGGADNFLKFIETELIPYVDSTYSVAPYRMLAGHSYGGLFTIHTLLTKPGLFNSYVALDPSLWWDNGVLAKRANTALQQKNFPDKPFYMAIANVLHTKKEIRGIEKDTTEMGIGMRFSFSVARSIDKYKKPGSLLGWKYYQDDSHGSVPLIGQYDALRFIFKGHQLLMPPDPADLKAEVYKNHYQNLAKLMGYTVLPPEIKLYRAGATLMEMGRPEQAYSFFKMSTEYYPQSFIGWDSLGDYYASKGEKEKAFEHYRKALSLKDYPQTRQKLEKLVGGK